MTIDFSKVNKYNMLLWYRALKSGQFEQGKNYLGRREPDGQVRYCCLGVACEVAIANGLNLNRFSANAIFRYSGTHEDEYTSTGSHLPAAVMDWLGIDEHAPQIATDVLDMQSELCTHDQCDCDAVTAIRANDSMDWTFDQIADAVYEFYELAEVDPEAVRG